MSNQFEPEADDRIQEKKKSQQLLLLLLLLLILVFVYLYFFTSLIRPRPQAPPKPQPLAEGPVVKRPLPPRPELAKKTAGGETAAPAKEAKAKPGEAAQAAKAGPAAAAAAKPAKPAGKAELTPQQATGKPARQPVPPAQAKAANQVAPAKKGAAPHAEAAAKAARPSAAEKKPQLAVAGPAGKPGAKPSAAAKPVEKGAVKPGARPAGGAKLAKKEEAPQGAAAHAKKVKPASKAAAPAYALEINGDLAESEMGPISAKLKKAGVGHLVKTTVHKGETMHRLFLADFGNHDEAQEELERLKLAAPSAFILKENGRYAVYAGSYLRAGKAAVEQDRLYEKGVKLVLKTATAPVAVVRLRAGSFANQAGAERAAGKLKQAGVAAKVVKVAK